MDSGAAGASGHEDGSHHDLLPSCAHGGGDDDSGGGCRPENDKWHPPGNSR